MGPWIDVLALALCITFLGYVLAILMPFLRQQRTVDGDSATMQWHLLIPCLDEAAVIARTVTGLRSMHPTAHVWAVDDDSDDETLTIVQALADSDPMVHVVRREQPEARQGKGAALNSGWQAIREHLHVVHGSDYRAVSEHVVIGVIDADGVLDPRALSALAGPAMFADPQVGAAQVQVRMVNRGLTGRVDAGDPEAPSWGGRLLVTLQDLEFRTVIAAMQHLRRRLGSVGMGGNGQFSRLSVLDDIADEHGTPWHGALLEDFELGLHVLLAGRSNQYANDVWVAQEGLPDVAALLRQRTRWAQGGMQCMRYLGEVLRSRRLSTPAALEICYFLLIPWTQLIGSLVYTAAWTVMLRYAWTSEGIGAWFSSGTWGLIPLILVFGIGPLALWGPVYRVTAEPDVSRGKAFLLGLAYWLYSYLMVISVWRAAIRLARSRTDWVKTPRVYRKPHAGTAASPQLVRAAHRSSSEPAVPQHNHGGDS